MFEGFSGMLRGYSWFPGNSEVSRRFLRALREVPEGSRGILWVLRKIKGGFRGVQEISRAFQRISMVFRGILRDFKVISGGSRRSQRLELENFQESYWEVSGVF